MPEATRHYRFVLRNKTDDADLLVVTSVPGGTNPYIKDAPQGDGPSVDPLTGRVTVGSFVGTVIDAEGATAEEVVVWREDFGSYADTAAVLAVWTEIDDAGIGTWTLTDERVVVDAKSMRCVLDGAFDTGDNNRLSRVVSGLTPGQSYRRYYQFLDDTNVAPTVPDDVWILIGPTTHVANGSGEVTITIGTTGVTGVGGGTFTAEQFYTAGVYLTTTQATGGRIVTSILADAGGVWQVLGNRARWDVSDDGGSTWDNLVNGYLNRLTLTDALVWEVEVGDTDRVEQQATLFTDVDRTLAEPSCLLGGPVPGGFGGQADHGMPVFKVEAVDSTGDTRFVELVYESGPLPPFTPGTGFNASGPDLDEARRVVNGAAVPLAVAADEYIPNDRYWQYPALSCAVYNLASGALVGTFTPISRALGGFEEVIGDLDPDGLRDRGIGRSLVTPGMRFSIAWRGTGTEPAQPSVNAKYKILLYANQISDKAPFHQSGHPVDVAARIATYLGIAYDAAALTATKNTLGPDLYVELRHKTTMNAAALLQVLFGAFGFAWRVDATDSEREFYVTRLRTSATPVIELTADDLRHEGQPFDLAEASAVTRVIWRQRQFAVWSSDSYDDRPLDGLVEADDTIRAILASSAAGNASERVLTYDVPGRITSATNATRDWTEDFVGGIAETIYGRWAGGNPTTVLPVLGSVAVEVGDYVVADVAFLPNAIVGQVPTARRGERQVVQVVQRTETPGGPDLRVIRGGPDLGDAPTPLVPTLSIAASASLPKKRAAVTVTNHAAIAGTDYTVRIEFGTGATLPDGFAVAGLLSDTAGDDILSLPVVDAGAHVWARARLERIIGGVPQLGAYSTVVDVDLTDLTAPSNVAATVRTGWTTGLYDLTWDVGEASQPVVVEYQQAGDTEWITLGVFAPGTTSAIWAIPDVSVDWDLQVFHREAPPFAGESAADTVTVTAPGGTPDTLDPPTQLTATVLGGWGQVKICYLVGDTPSKTDIESALETAVGAGTFGAYAVVETKSTGFFNVGDQICRIVTYAIDGKQRKIRARHTWPGLTPSAYTSEVTFTPGVAGAGTGGSGPGDAQYLVLAAHDDLINERVLTAGTAISVTDAGAGGAATVAVTTVPIANGGTGQAGATAAFDALAPTTTQGDLIVHNGTDNVRLPAGTNGHVLTLDSTETAGVKWAAPLESLLSVFGSGATDPADAEVRGGPMQWAGVFTDWRVATVDGGTGTIAFDVKKNGTSMIGAGAAPALSAAASASGSCGGWTTTSFAAGDRITVHVNGAPSGGPGETTVALGATRS